MTTVAFCWRSGEIEFGEILPEGAIEIARGPERKVRDLMTATARHGYKKGTLLVPGIPEAQNSNDAIDALDRFVEWIATRHHPDCHYKPINPDQSQSRGPPDEIRQPPYLESIAACTALSIRWPAP